MENVVDGLGLLGVGDKDFEHVEGLELDALALVAQQVHHQLEVRRVANVSRHDVEVGAVQQELSQQLRQATHQYQQRTRVSARMARASDQQEQLAKVRTLSD